jgi:hypothetical protein
VAQEIPLEKFLENCDDAMKLFNEKVAANQDPE